MSAATMKKKKVSKRSKATYRQSTVKSDKISDFKYDSKPSNLQRAEVSGKESLADRELKKLQKADVFRSNPKTIKQTNSHPRRYK